MSRKVRRRTLYDFDLRSLQRYLVRMMEKVAFIWLAVDMSLGKTGAVLAFLYEKYKQHPEWRVLVVAPLEVARTTWPEELNLWYHAREIPYALCIGDEAQRKRALYADKWLTIINKENLQWLWAELRNGKNWDFDVIVIDESDMLAGGKHRTNRAGGGKGSRPLSRFGIIARARALRITKHVILLTGTPASEGLKSMWGQMYVLDLGERLGRKKTHFTQRWFDTGYMGWDMDPLPHAEREIMEAVSDTMFSLRAEDHLKLPPVITTPDTDLVVKLPPDVMREYKKFKRELFTDRYDVEAVSNGVLINKLLQFSNGSMYREDGRDVWVHDMKAHKLRELVDSLNGRPLLVAISFDFDRARIRKFLGKKLTLIEEAGKNWKKDWDRGRLPVLAGHPASFAHGLNLQHGGARACHYGICHSGLLYTQFNGRLPRPGQQEDHVWVYHIIAEGTEDRAVLESKQAKQGSEAAIRRYVQVLKADIDRELRDE